MTAICGGGTSAPKPGVVTNNFISAATITTGLLEITPYLAPFAGMIDAFVYNATNQCTGDPPAMPTSAQLNPLNIIGGVFNPNSGAWVTAANNLLLNWCWLLFCQCTSAPVPVLTYPGPPANVSVPSPVTGLTYQQQKAADAALAAWALVESSGTTFAPYIGGQSLALTGVADYQQTGPFPTSFGLNLHVGAKLGLTFIRTVLPPFSTECWLKLSNIAPASTQILFYYGNNTLNGSGLYLATNGHVHFLSGGVQDIDTGFVWPDLNWHMLDLTSDSNTGPETIYFDGAVVWRNTITNPLAPSPNTVFFGGDSGVTANQQVTYAMPTLYPYSLSPALVRQEFGTALSSGAGGGTGGSASLGSSDAIMQLLQLIYQSLPVSLSAYAESTVHNALTGHGTITLVNVCLAVRVDITADTTGFTTDIGSPNFLFDRGFIVPIALEGPIRTPTRLVYNPQLYPLPPLTEQIGYTLPPGVTIKITELIRGP